MKFSYLYLTVVLVLLCGITGCRKSVSNTEVEVFCPVEYTFETSYDKTWNATRRAVMELSNIEVMHKKNGIITSDITSVDSAEMAFLDNASGKTYKFTYDVKLSRKQDDATMISTQVKLLPEQFLVKLNNENNEVQAENYLREKLYKKICGNLFSNGKGRCKNGFIEQQPVEEQQPEEIAPPPPPPPKGFDPKIKSAQEALNRAGYKSGPEDGLIGKKTRKALKNFQRDSGLPVTGILDDKTQSLLSAYLQD